MVNLWQKGVEWIEIARSDDGKIHSPRGYGMTQLLDFLMRLVAPGANDPVLASSYKRTRSQRFFDFWADLGMWHRFGLCVVSAVFILLIVLIIL